MLAPSAQTPVMPANPAAAVRPCTGMAMSGELSANHAGLQVADLLASSLVFPMAASAYCKPRIGAVHSSTRYAVVRQEFGARLKGLQYRYRDETGHWRGGLVVSDPVGHQPGSLLFRS